MRRLHAVRIDRVFLLDGVDSVLIGDPFLRHGRLAVALLQRRGIGEDPDAPDRVRAFARDVDAVVQTQRHAVQIATHAQIRHRAPGCGQTAVAHLHLFGE